MATSRFAQIADKGINEIKICSIPKQKKIRKQNLE